jgi:homoserine dehydrogenase
MTVHDEPGVLAGIASRLAHHGVSIEAVRQKAAGADTGLATIVISTHRAPEAEVTKVLDALRGSDAVTEIRSVLRIEGE